MERREQATEVVAELKEASHSHELVTYLYHVKVPYHTDPREIEFEPTREMLSNLPEQLAELAEFKDDEVRRVVTSVAILLEKYPHRSLEEAFDTAMIWERG